MIWKCATEVYLRGSEHILFQISKYATDAEQHQ